MVLVKDDLGGLDEPGRYDADEPMQLGFVLDGCPDCVGVCGEFDGLEVSEPLAQQVRQGPGAFGPGPCRR